MSCSFFVLIVCSTPWAFKIRAWCLGLQSSRQCSSCQRGRCPAAPSSPHLPACPTHPVWPLPPPCHCRVSASESEGEGGGRRRRGASAAGSGAEGGSGSDAGSSGSEGEEGSDAGSEEGEESDDDSLASGGGRGSCPARDSSGASPRRVQRAAAAVPPWAQRLAMLPCTALKTDCALSVFRSPPTRRGPGGRH